MPPGIVSPIGGTYDPKRVIVTANGIPLTGFAEGDSITIERVTPERVTSKVGIDGESCRAIVNDLRGRVKLRLMHSSMSNPILDAYAKADRATGRGAFALNVTDLNSGSNYTMPRAWIAQMPPVAFGNEVGVREWTIDGDYLEETTIGIIPTPVG